MPNFALNGLEFYNAPKNAGTTVRMWLKLYEDGLCQKFTPQGYYNLAGVGLPRQWTDTTMGKPQFFAPGEVENSRWCIVRDPVDRFVSAFTDKILRERLAPWTLDTCLSLMESEEMERIARSSEPTPLKQAACHMLGQCFWFGQNRSYFDHIFDIRDMNCVREFCEDVVFKMTLPKFHARNQSQSGVDKIELSRDDRRRLDRIYSADFLAGWF